MAWMKGLHVVAIVFWSASLIYLPILLAGHSPRLSNRNYLQLHGMVRNVYVWVASPFAIMAIVTGMALIPLRDVTAPWFMAKLLVVAALAVIHARCGSILAKQSHSAERANAWVRAMRIIMPLVLFPCVLWLVLSKPRIDYTPTPPQYLKQWLGEVRKRLEPAAATSMPLSLQPALRTPVSHPASRRSTPGARLETRALHPTGTALRPGPQDA